MHYPLKIRSVSASVQATDLKKKRECGNSALHGNSALWLMTVCLDLANDVASGLLYKHITVAGIYTRTRQILEIMCALLVKRRENVTSWRYDLINAIVRL